MKTKEELQVLKEEYEKLILKLSELSDDEVAEVAGGDSSKDFILKHIVPHVSGDDVC